MNTENSLEKWICGEAEPPPFRSTWVEAHELLKALILTSMASQTKHPVLYVAHSKGEARNAIDHIQFLTGQKPPYFPPIDFDYHIGILPDPFLVIERNLFLFDSLNSKSGIFVTTAEALLQKVLKPTVFKGAIQTLKPNIELERETFLSRLEGSGYQKQPVVYDPGVFAVRGSVIDVFSPYYAKPLRLEFYGDLIEEIRFFDPQSQRSLDKRDEVFIVPVGVGLFPGGDKRSIISEGLKIHLDDEGFSKVERDQIMENIFEGQSQHLHRLFPLISEGSDSIFHYFPSETISFWDGRETLEHIERETLPNLTKQHGLFKSGHSPISEIQDLFLSASEVKTEWDRERVFFFEAFQNGVGSELKILNENVSFKSLIQPSPKLKSSHPTHFEPLARKFKEWIDEGYRIHIVCHTHTHIQRFIHLFEPYYLTFEVHEGAAFPAMLKMDGLSIHLWQGYLSQSLRLNTLRLMILNEEDIFGHKKRIQKTSDVKSAELSEALSNFRDLQVGDIVVHRDFGVGRYLGLKSMDFLGVPNDYMLLEYKDQDKLYLPIYRLNVIQKYLGRDGIALDKLGGDQWTKAKSKAQKAAEELAAEILNLQAKRLSTGAFPFPIPGEEFEQFEMDFPFDETTDQETAIEQVMTDLSKNHPMDRLLVGDVGYGKTEVAMRAAFRAAFSGKQVAVLVPTTILAFQHHTNFTERFKNFPIRVEMVSRLKTSAEIKQTLLDLKNGKVDIIVGTHRLLSSDVAFKDLSLIVVDEEHRFGVLHKERLKKLSHSVHVLSMSATPIPRTLNMAMTGIKEISLLNTPPPDRLSVRTFVCRSSDEVMRDAIFSELNRGGQVFFVHNRIETIFKVAHHLKELCKDFEIEVVHGQMMAQKLEKKMLEFYKGTVRILVTTAIIESGLDIPNANTIIIDRADCFGLAQLYQLRGRVGRSQKRAFCYLLLPNEGEMTDEAKERIQILQRYSELGGGFNIASHDLELRGAGDLLGKEQSGHLHRVGVDLYLELLEQSIRELKGQEKRITIEPEINLKIPAFFPEDYLPDISQRISFYRKLSAIENDEMLSSIEEEIKDRFGPLPMEVISLLGLMKLKMHLKKLHVLRMSSGPKKTSLQFADTTPVPPDKLVKFIKSQNKGYSLTPDHKLVFPVEEKELNKLIHHIQFLEESLLA